MPHLSAERRVLHAEPGSRKPPGERARWPGPPEGASSPSRSYGPGVRSRPTPASEVEAAIARLQLALIARTAAAPAIPEGNGLDREAELQGLALALMLEVGRIARLVREHERRF